MAIDPFTLSLLAGPAIFGLQNMFGGGEKPSVDTQRLPLLTEGQTGFLNNAVPQFQNQFDTLGGFQNLGFENLLNQMSQQSGVFNTGTNALLQQLTGGPQDINQFFQDTVQDPLLQNFQEDILPGISRQYASNFFSSDRQNADARAQEELLRQLTQARSGFSFNARENDLNRNIQAAQSIPQLQLAQQQGSLTPTQTMQQLLASVTGVRPFENLVTTNPGSASAGSSFLGGFGGGLGGGLGKKLGGLF